MRWARGARVIYNKITPKEPEPMNTTPAKMNGSVNSVRLQLEDGHDMGDYRLPTGATVGDLLRAAHVDPKMNRVLIDGKSLEESIGLTPGSVVTLVPNPVEDDRLPRWERSIGMFKDDEGFAEFVASVQARRESEPTEDGDL